MDAEAKSCANCRNRFTDSCKLSEKVTVLNNWGMTDEIIDSTFQYALNEISIDDLFGEYKKKILNISNITPKEQDLVREQIIKKVAEQIWIKLKRQEFVKLDYDIKIDPDFYCKYWE